MSEGIAEINHRLIYEEFLDELRTYEKSHLGKFQSKECNLQRILRISA